MPDHDNDNDPTIGPQDPHDAETIAPSATPWSTPDIPDSYSSADLDIGQELGPYKIIDVLGEGGFGSVYKAEQSRPVKRQVALKIIKLGMDTKRVIARFEAERQALAVMDHPGIAHVLDAGSTDTGRPFFVMELVKGIPFSEYCDTNNLKNRERLELFIEVCKAIQHAHHKGIIHRDLKPSNVLVALQDNVPTPKVIDFGIAKAMNQQLGEQTVYTQMQQLIGTPEYMSPEQAENSGLDIDTRSDIYSLGVMLFELLTGFTPFDAQELRQTAISDLPRKLREAPTPKPSMRLTQITETQADSAAKHHQLSRTQLRKELKGDLDWIVLKALEKDRTRRYDSATALADDIQRYLNDEPVMAGPPSTVYRFHKFAKRNKPLIAASTAISVSVVAGLAFSTYSFVKEREARQDAIAAKEDADQQRDAALAARAESEAVTDFLVQTLSAVDPAGLGREVTVRDVLDFSLPRIGNSFSDQPHIEARLNKVVGDTYLALGNYELAQPPLLKAAETFEALDGARDENTLAAKESVGDMLLKSGELDAARSVLEATIQTRTEVSGEFALDTLAANIRLASLYKSYGQFDTALEMYTNAIASLSEHHGQDHPEALRASEQLAHTQMLMGNHSNAEPILVATYETQSESLAPDHPDTLKTLSRLASLRRDLGQYEASEELFERARPLQERVLGEFHPETIFTISQLGWLYMQMGKAQNAENLYAEVLDRVQNVLSDQHPATIEVKTSLAQILIDRNKYAEAEILLDEALESQSRVLGREHPETLRILSSIALVHRRMGSVDQALREYEEVIEIQTRINGPTHPNTVASRTNLGNVLSDLGQYDRALQVLEEVLSDQKETLGAEHPTTLGIEINLAGILWRQSKYDEAEPMYLDLLERCSRVLGEEHSYTLTAMSNLALLYKNQERNIEAERMYLRTLNVQKTTLGEIHASTLQTKQNLASLYTATNRASEAEPLMREVLEANLESLGENHPSTLRSVHALGIHLAQQQKVDEAVPLIARAHDGRAEALGEDHSDTQDSRRTLGILNFQTGNQQEAARLLYRWLESRHRTHGQEDPGAIGMATNLMLLFHQLGDVEITRKIALDLLVARQQLANAPDASAKTINDFAVLLLDCVPENLRDPSQAVNQAQRAVDMTDGQNAAMLATLARAQFETGDAPTATETLRRAIAILPEGDQRAGYEQTLATYEQDTQEQTTPASDETGAGSN